MGGVRTLAIIFVWIGWISLVGSVILIARAAGSMQNAFRSGDATIATIGALLPLVLLCLGPFLAWGILTGLCEIHRQNEYLIESVDDLKRRPSPGNKTTAVEPEKPIP